MYTFVTPSVSGAALLLAADAVLVLRALGTVCLMPVHQLHLYHLLSCSGSFSSGQCALVGAGRREAGRFWGGRTADRYADKEEHICWHTFLDGSRSYQAVSLRLQGESRDRRGGDLPVTALSVCSWPLNLGLIVVFLVFNTLLTLSFFRLISGRWESPPLSWLKGNLLTLIYTQWGSSSSSPKTPHPHSKGLTASPLKSLWRLV